MRYAKKIMLVVGISFLFSALIALVLKYVEPQLVDRIENVTYDWRYRFKYQGLADFEFPDYGIHIVDIDERSMDVLGSYWGWDRGYQARMVNALSSRFPAAVAFDILFYGREDDIRRERVANVLNSAIEGVPALANHSQILNERLVETVNYDVQFMDAIRNSGRVTLGISLADSGDYRVITEDVAGRMNMEWHNALNPASALEFHDSLLLQIGEVKAIIDGIYPENASAARNIGHVNIVDVSSTIRMSPLLYRFADFSPVYLPMSLRVAATLFGTPNDEIKFVPEQYIDLGKPFKIFSDDDGAISFSFPDFTMAQLQMILADSAAITSLDEGAKLQVSAYAALYYDDNNLPALETRSGRLPHDVTTLILNTDMLFDTMTVDNEIKLDDRYTAARVSSIEWEIFDDDVSYWLNPADVKTLPFIPRELFATRGISRCVQVCDTLHNISSNTSHNPLHDTSHETTPEISCVTECYTSVAPHVTKDDTTSAQLRRKLITFDFWVTREWGELVSSLPVLRGAALVELLADGANTLENISKNGRRDFGNNARVPLLRNNRHIVTYFGPSSRPFPYFSFYDVMENNINEPLEGRVFVVGSTSPALFDIKSAPHELVYPAVEIHASILNSIFTNQYVTRLSAFGDLFLLAAVGLAAALVAFSTKPFLGILIAAVMLAAYAVASFQIFTSSLLWIEMVRPMIAIVLSFTTVMVYRYMTEEKNKKFLQSTFKQYLSPELIDIMYTQKQKPQLGGDEGVRTAFFTDIEGFSTFSEKLTPTQLVELLNEYLTAMTDILLANRGTLDKYIGDAIVAFFGAPFNFPDHAQRACRTALDMQNKLAQLREKWKNEGDKWPPIVHDMRMRIGINTGTITTGNMGSATRMNYTMMGDSVNLAARLESAAKYYGVYTMISNFSHDKIKDAFDARMLDVITVMGKTESVTIYELLSPKGAMTNELREMVDVYNAALDKYYREKNFAEAKKLFEKSAAMEPHKDRKMTPSKRFIAMCENFIANPPGDDWDGVNRLDKK